MNVNMDVSFKIYKQVLSLLYCEISIRRNDIICKQQTHWQIKKETDAKAGWTEGESEGESQRDNNEEGSIMQQLFLFLQIGQLIR